jgi:excisionase family DNA binding protein
MAIPLPQSTATRIDERLLQGSDAHDLLTVKEAAHFLKVPVSWVYEHVRPEAQDRLPAVKLGKYLRFDARDLRAYIDAKRADSRRSRRG